MFAEEFLDRAEQAGLLQAPLLAKLRAQIAKSSKPVRAEKVAKLLIEKRLLTAAQAKQLLTRAAEEEATVAEAAPVDDLVPAGDLVPADDQPIPVGAAVAEEPLVPANDALGPAGYEDPAYGGAYEATADALGGAPAGGSLWGAAARGFRGKKTARRNPWESPWLLIGGGLLIFLLLVGGFLAFVLFRGSAQEMFEAAEESYRNESYSEAIERYSRYLERFPKDENVSKARVKRALAHIRLPVGSRSWKQALEVAKKQLAEVEMEPEFAIARPELRSLLPDIAEGFAQQAKEAEDVATAQELLALAEEAMTLVNNPNYIPGSDRRNPTIAKRIDTILEDMKIVRRQINKEKQLVASIESIRQSLANGRTDEAFAIRKQLLQDYPSLINDARLQEVVGEITQKEKEFVQPQPQSLAAAADDHPPQAEATICVANRVAAAGAKLEGTSSDPLVVLAEGSLFGLDPASGQLLWRRFVGYETLYHPQPLGDGDVLAVHARHQELLRLNARTGRLAWRLAIGEPFADPVVFDDAIFVATRAGRLLYVNPKDGTCSLGAQFPQQLTTGPAASSEWPYVYQPGEHSHLYVLSKGEMDCREVYYLGHQAGAIGVPPLLLRGYVVVAENAGPDYSRLHVLVGEQRGLKLKPAQPPVRLKGHVVLPMIVLGRQLLVVTDRGGVYFFEVQLGQTEQPVAKIIDFDIAVEQPTRIYPVVSEGRIWLAGDGFTSFQIQVAAGKLVRRWRKQAFDAFIAPLHVVRVRPPGANIDATHIVHVSRRRGLPGVSITATDFDSGEMLWRTDVGVEMVAQPWVDPNNRKVSCISEAGNLYVVDGDAPTGCIDQPAMRPSPTELGLSFRHAVQLSDGRWVLTGQGDAEYLLLYEPGQTRPLRLVRLKDRAGRISGVPTALGDGVLIGFENGELWWIDPETGGLKDPNARFLAQPRPGTVIQWSGAAVLQEGRRLMVADNRRQVFQLVVGGSSPELKREKTASLKWDLVSRLYSIGDRIVGVGRTESSDHLVVLQADKLEPTADPVLRGRVVWGPYVDGQDVLVATDENRLYAFASDGTPRWEKDLPHGRPVGKPQRSGDRWVLALLAGRLVQLDAETGDEVGQAVLDGPLASGPVPMDDRWWVCGSGGVLYRTTITSP